MDYISIIGLEHPGVEVYCTGDPTDYDNIIWSDPLNKLTKAELDASILTLTKRNKILELSKECENVIIAGFTSSALGIEKIYDSEEVDQINLIGSVSTTTPTPAEPTGYTIYYACRDPETNIKSYIEHTHYQLRQVMADGATFKLVQLQRFNTLRNQVNEATTVEDIEAIIW